MKAQEPRIPPLDPPYDDATAAMLAKWMPPGADVEPLKLFRTLIVHPDLMSRMRPLGSGILASTTVEPRHRELMILRTTALAGAHYEWGVHATAFGPQVGIDAATADAIATRELDSTRWSEEDLLILRAATELHDTARIQDDLWRDLAGRFTTPQLIELIVTAGWYRLISYAINATGVQPEPWAQRAPQG